MAKRKEIPSNIRQGFTFATSWPMYSFHPIEHMLLVVLGLDYEISICVNILDAGLDVRATLLVT